MNIKVDEEFLKICRLILSKNLSEDEWAKIESGDMFQEKQYVGGFEGIEKAFCFSFYDHDNQEFWFQVTLGEINEIVDGIKTNIVIRKADS
jgi:hypothetical protein